MSNSRFLFIRCIYYAFVAFIVSCVLFLSYLVGRELLDKRSMSTVDVELGKRLRASEGLNAHGSRARAPYVMFRPEPGNRTGGWINSLGFHSPEINEVKGKDEFRVAILGGSVVFTSGPMMASPEYLSRSIVAQFASILKERVPGLADKQITYINAGIPSGVSGQDLAQFLHHVMPLDVDLLIVLNGFNDFYVPFNAERRPGYPVDYIVEEYRFVKGRDDQGGSGAMADLQKLYKALGVVVPSEEERKKGILSHYIMNNYTIAATARGMGIDVGIFMQPYSARNLNPVLELNNHHMVKLYNAARNAYKELGACGGSGVFFGDLTVMNDRLDPYFTDVVHGWWDPTHRMLAEQIYQDLNNAGFFSKYGNLGGARVARPEADRDFIKCLPISRVREIIRESQLLSAGIFNNNELDGFLRLGMPGVSEQAVEAIKRENNGILPGSLQSEFDGHDARLRSALEKYDDERSVQKRTEQDGEHSYSAIALDGGQALSSGDHVDGYTASMAFDDNLQTIWGSAQIGSEVADKAFIGYDFGDRECLVRQIRLKQGGRVGKVSVQSKGLQDSEWSNVRVDLHYERDGWDVLTLTSPSAARYWRVLALENAGEHPAAWTLYEVKFYQ